MFIFFHSSALGSNEATPEELAGGTKPAPKTAPKASAKAKPKPKAKGKNATESSEKHDRSPVKPDQPSPNPVPPKRMRGKQPEDQAKEIEELRKVWFFSSGAHGVDFGGCMHKLSSHCIDP